LTEELRPEMAVGRGVEQQPRVAVVAIAPTHAQPIPVVANVAEQSGRRAAVARPRRPNSRDTCRKPEPLPRRWGNHECFGRRRLRTSHRGTGHKEADGEHRCPREVYAHTT